MLYVSAWFIKSVSDIKKHAVQAPKSRDNHKYPIIQADDTNKSNVVATKSLSFVEHSSKQGP